MGQDGGTGVGALDAKLSRLQRRAARQRRKIAASKEAWQAWSATMDEVADLTQRLVTFPTLDLGALATKFSAILWLIEANGSVLDSADLRRLRRFRRELTLISHK